MLYEVITHPDFRKKGLGKILYKRFFEICRKQNRMIVRACTSPVNAGSIAFHRKIGFQIETGDDEIGGIAVTRDS